MLQERIRKGYTLMEKKITVTLAGQIFTIINQDDLDYVEEIARQTDNKIRHVQKENEYFSVTAAAVLSCMDFCDELNKAQKELVQRNKELFDEREKNSLLTEQLKNLMNEVQSLKLAAKASQDNSGSEAESSDNSSQNGESENDGENSGESHLCDSKDESLSKNEAESEITAGGKTKRPGKKEYVPRNNRKRNKNKKESGRG